LYSLESLRLFSVYSRFSANSVLVSCGRYKLMLRQFVTLSKYRVFIFHEEYQNMVTRNF
jgi:hypothetical protein